MLTLLVLQLSLVSCIQALGIFIPLNLDPGSGTCSVWSKIITSISANPQTPFFSIVNPDDGPGDNGSQPDAAYRQCVQALRPHANATVLGLINTEGGKKSLSNVLAEIDTYANWDLPYRPTGIFFDGVPAKGNFVSQYETYTTYTRGKGFKFIAMDPGEMPDPGFFGIADLINTYETAYSAFNADDDVFATSSTPASQQSVWLTQAPKNGSYSAVISQLVKKGVRAAYISDLPDDQSGIPSQWTSFAGDVGKANAAQIPNSTVPSETNMNTSSSQPPATAGTTVTTSSHPPVGAIVGGVLGALAIISILLGIVFIIRRGRRRYDYNVPFTGAAVTHPFDKFKSVPSATNQSGLSTIHNSNAEEPKDSPSEIDAESGRSLSGHGHYVLPGIQTTLQSAPSSSGVLGQSDGQPDPTVAGSVSGASSGPVTKQFHVTNHGAVRRSISTLRRTSNPPPPTYFP